MVNMKKDLPRREMIRKIGISAVSLSAISGTAAAEKSDSQTQNGTSTPAPTKGGEPDDGHEVTPQLVTNWTSEWSPYEVNESDTSILKSRWNVISPTIASYHRFDALVEASMAERPEMVSSNIGAGAVKKNWVYTEDTALGVPAYHFKAKMLVAQPTGSELYLDSRVKTERTGQVEARTGCYFDPATNLAESWSRAYLTVE
ncbi:MULTISPECIES: hypothetical protein [unclassified Haloferax]|uniref:hypothetical protein n=1 Tax=unclassified Haloferax TaxID=2625095 RepID=UPI0028771817|nr:MULTISPECIES: hypothetical protein [unclassified Haloferax]MDS0241397.1 hypothetical protein [Haloferax sp. S2CR25]MDS0241738.1 hypothetical protein [Haloferax sp. S2CR25]MDS0444518.1 hypothetical protein [Haloferax sp. S2CR25-2]MDS0444859.1 hypothetical protein [Haloferax sp. S2CR25-2]